MLSDLRRMTQANMAERVDRFRRALNADLVLPRTFGPPRWRARSAPYLGIALDYAGGDEPNAARCRSGSAGSED